MLKLHVLTATMVMKEKRMKFKELEKIVLADGWRYKGCVGSHHQYVHSVKPGKVTIPNHTGDISNAVVQSVLKQAGLKK